MVGLGARTQKIMMSDAKDVLVPVKFVGLGGVLPQLARGMVSLYTVVLKFF